MGDATGPADEGPSLELPSLFRRRRKSPAPEPPAEPAAAAQLRTVEPAPPGAVDTADPAAPPAAEAEPTVVVAQAEPQPHSEPAARADSAVEAHQEAPARRTRGAERRVAPIEPRIEPQVEPRVEPRVHDHHEPGEPAAPRVPLGKRVRDAVPAMSLGTAAAVVGAVVGLLGCVATWIGLQGCEAVTGARTCGGPGLLVLIAIAVGQVLLGAALLKVVDVPEAGNVSFLGVGLMVVIALLVLVDHLYDGWMFVAIPLVTAATFAAARWTTTRYADDTDDHPAEQHDIR